MSTETRPGLGGEFQSKRESLLVKVNAALEESEYYLDAWAQEMVRQKNVGDRNIHNVCFDWLQKERKDFLEAYQRTIASQRAKAGFGRIGAHGTFSDSLFSGGSRHPDPEGKGLIREGLTRGDFARLECFDEPGGLGGWWSGVRGGARPAPEIWILRSDNLDTQGRFLLIFPDPRTYDRYLQELKKMVEDGELPVSHGAMRIDQLRDYLENHDGRLPDEVETK